MKKFISIMTMLLTALTSLSLSSCDDGNIADTLEGTWKGNMYVSSSYNNQVYDATYSEICFSEDPYAYANGTGYWVDYYDNSSWGTDYVANHITWEVKNKIIYIHFVEEDTNISIGDYSLNDNYFKGRIYYGSEKVDFTLQHTSSPNWNNYTYNQSWRSTGSPQRPKRFFRTK